MARSRKRARNLSFKAQELRKLSGAASARAYGSGVVSSAAASPDAAAELIIAELDKAGMPTSAIKRTGSTAEYIAILDEVGELVQAVAAMDFSNVDRQWVMRQKKQIESAAIVVS